MFGFVALGRFALLLCSVCERVAGAQSLVLVYEKHLNASQLNVTFFLLRLLLGNYCVQRFLLFGNNPR
jgi:hypothetical protein